MRSTKILTLSLLLLLLSGAFFFQKAQVKVDHKLPDEITPGSSKEVTVRIHKGERNGFAKLELQVPEGMKVQPVEKSGASFSSKKGIAKFIWMSMPEGGQFMVRYRLIAKKGIEAGEKTMKGSFRYLDENKRKEVDLDPQKIRIPEKVAQKSDDGEKREKTASSDEVQVERKIERLGEKRFEIRTKLKKGKLQDFAKLIDTIPEGFKVVPKKERGSSFSMDGRKAKFVWMSLPRRTTIKLRYRLIAQKVDSGTHRIKGGISYLKDGNTTNKKVEFYEVWVGPKEEKSAQKEKEDTSSTDGSDEVVEDVPDPQKGVDYRVQICAGHDEVDEDHFAKVYDYQGDYDIDHHEGWLKYLTGKFDVYRKARDKRVYFRENFDLPGPFVTAYNDGERITVQEALMITEQEWVQ